VLGLASVTSLVVRFRCSQGVERQQLKVVHLWRRRRPGPPAGHLSGVTGAQRADPRPSRGGRALAAPPLAIGVAVLRYRLYDIDRIINRTPVYGLLTVLLGVIYSGIVLALGQLFGGMGEDPPSWVVAGRP
jgi:hypothetical protein